MANIKLDKNMIVSFRFTVADDSRLPIVLQFSVFNRRSRVRAVVSKGSTGLVGQNTSCKAHKVCISLWPTGWNDVFCS